MTLEQLRVLNAIVTEGTFHGAAQRLNKSQPALSHMIKKLEEEVGVDLISRASYRPTLTPSGEIFHRKALRVLQEARELSELSHDLSGQEEAELHLVITATCELAPLLSIIDQVRSRFKNTHIRLSIEAMGGPIEKLMEDDADMIIATFDGVVPEKVVSAPYQTINIYPVCHKDYPPAKASGPIVSTEMRDFPQIVVSDKSTPAYQQSRNLFEENQRWSVSDFASKKQIIMSAMGWGGLPEHLIEDELKSGDLIALNLEQFPVRHSKLMLMRKRTQVHGPVAKALWKAILS
ncbi:LysR family transcriptional regulator [Terasakiella sp. A23]|uniref:LysR family transcriptional regulator n=1 Tax=Terasakiella sp. FCG-A23 TaxID=3080561 RepID=UPI0029535CF0|nr:LysR family transcriptional regulator [Terasakiella sp. A23]MDV7340483.1 LysR family transcriptional regulator [Terasakiella sp. A23]